MRVFLYERVSVDDEVFLNSGQKFVVQHYNPENSTLKLSSVRNRNEAENLRGEILFAKKEKLAQGCYYVSDLLGKKLVVVGDEHVCTIKNIHNYGAGDILEVEYKCKTLLIPFVHQFFSDDLSVEKETIEKFILD